MTHYLARGVTECTSCGYKLTYVLDTTDGTDWETLTKSELESFGWSTTNGIYRCNECVDFR